MKILVASKDNNGLESTVSEKFGRAPFFTIVYTEDKDIREEETENHKNQFVEESRNAGVNSAKFYAVGNNIDAVIAGNIESKARSILNEADINVVTGHTNKRVKDAVLSYLNSRLKKATKARSEGMEAKTEKRSIGLIKSKTTAGEKPSGAKIAALIIIILAILFALYFFLFR